MSVYDNQVGVCGPVGCAPGAYGYPYGYPYAAYPGYAPLVPTFPGGSWDIVGADPAQPAQPGVLDRIKTFGQQETFGIKNQNIALGALALGGIYYAYTKGMFGGHRRR